MLHANDKFITHNFIKFARNPESKLSVCMGVIAELGIQRGGAFLEIGANVGTETLEAAWSGKFNRIVVVEPEPGNTALLKANVAANNLDTQVQIIQAGVSDHDGYASIQLSYENMGDHRVIEGKDGGLRLMTLNSVLAAADLKPSEISLVWMDTQGHEGQIMKGATAYRGSMPFSYRVLACRA